MKINIFLTMVLLFVCVVETVQSAGAGAQTTIQETMKLAEQGNVKAQFSLAVRYIRGDGVAENEMEAMKWFRKAAERGDADAQFNLGIAYENGIGVAMNKAESVKWIRKAAEQGNATAQFNLGSAYRNGIGVAENKTEAMKLFRKAAEQGDADAMYSLGEIYRDGDGVAKNRDEAEKWFARETEQRRKMADFKKWFRKAMRGDADAMHSLGKMYLDGVGVAKNKTEAEKWFANEAEQRKK